MNGMQASIVLCAWCDRMRAGPLAWRTVDPNWVTQTGQVATHSICPRCKSELLRQVACLSQMLVGAA